MRNLPTQHGHHIKTHLPEDLPVFHLNDLCSNQEQDSYRHVAERGKASQLENIWNEGDALSLKQKEIYIYTLWRCKEGITNDHSLGQ